VSWKKDRASLEDTYSAQKKTKDHKFSRGGRRSSKEGGVPSRATGTEIKVEGIKMRKPSLPKQEVSTLNERKVEEKIRKNSWKSTT